MTRGIPISALDKKLGLLRDHVLRLRERRRPTLEEFARSRDLQDATGMSFIAGFLVNSAGIPSVAQFVQFK